MKSARTEMLLRPSMEECIAAAAKCDPPMPAAEGRKFFYHYESNGWKVGKVVMKSFAGSMGGWHERWLERTGGNSPQGNGNGDHGPAPMTGAQLMLKQKEYERILARQKQIRDSYDSHADCMRPSDRAEWLKLVARKKLLKAELGIVI
jgi:hypothetical protein